MVKNLRERTGARGNMDSQDILKFVNIYHEYKVGLRTSTRALVYEAVMACTRVHFENSVTRKVLYYRPRNQTLV